MSRRHSKRFCVWCASASFSRPPLRRRDKHGTLYYFHRKCLDEAPPGFAGKRR